MQDTGSVSTRPEHERDDETVIEAFAAHLQLERGRSEHTVRAYRREACSLLAHPLRSGYRPLVDRIHISISTKIKYTNNDGNNR